LTCHQGRSTVLRKSLHFVPMTARPRLVLTPIGDDPEVGRWLAALEDGRRSHIARLRDTFASRANG